MTCPNCGEQAPEHSKFCPLCGQRCDEPPAEITRLADTSRSGSTPAEAPGTTTSSLSIPQLKKDSVPTGVSRATYWWVVFGLVGGLVGWALVKDRDPRLARNVLIAGAAVSAGGIVVYTIALGGLLAGGLSSLDDAQAEADPASVGSDADPAAGSGTDLQGQPTISEFSWVYIDDADLRMRVDVMVDEPVRSSDSTYVEVGGTQYTPGEMCGVTDDSTGIVAVDFNVENESSSSVAADLDFSIDAEYERFFTDGPECYTYGSSSGSWSDGLDPGESGNSVVAVLVPGYFANGEGDPSLLEDITLTPEPTDFAGVYELSGASLSGNGFTLMPREGAVGQPTAEITDSTPSQDVTGYYTGTMTAHKSDTVYDVVFDLTQDGSEVTGTVTATSRDTGNRGTYRAEGYFEDGRLVLNGKDWVDKPNASWFMDHIDLDLNGETLTGTYAALDEPGKPIGDVYAVR